MANGKAFFDELKSLGFKLKGCDEPDCSLMVGYVSGFSILPHKSQLSKRAHWDVMDSIREHVPGQNERA